MADACGVILRGLPFQADVDDIKDFFKPLSIPNSHVQIIVCSDGLSSGMAFVELRDEEEVKRALLMDHNHIGNRYIEVMRISEGKLDEIRSAASEGATRQEMHRLCSGTGSEWNGRRKERERQPHYRDRSPRGRITAMRTRFAYITGLPPGAMYKDVRQFFDGCLIAKGCIHLIRDQFNHFRGDGYVEFASSDEVKKGLRKDGMMLRGSEVRIDPCSEEEVLDMLPYTERRDNNPHQSQSGSQNPGAHQSRAVHFEEGYGGYRIEKEGYGGYRREGDRGQDTLSYFGYREEFDTTKGERGRGGFEPVEYESAYSTAGGRGRSRSSYSKQQEPSGRFDRYGGHTSPVAYQPPPMGYSVQQSPHSTKTLKMQGIPVGANPSDVVAFFKNYGIQFEDVRMQCHEDGSPNGKAFVTFPSERISQAAFHDMSGRMIRGIPIELYPV